MLRMRNRNGIRFNAVIVPETTERKAVVKIFDARHDNFAPEGQFVSSYFVETLLARPDGNGINLHGGVPDWSLDADATKKLLDWLKT